MQIPALIQRLILPYSVNLTSRVCWWSASLGAFGKLRKRSFLWRTQEEVVKPFQHSCECYLVRSPISIRRRRLCGPPFFIMQLHVGQLADVRWIGDRFLWAAQQLHPVLRVCGCRRPTSALVQRPPRASHDHLSVALTGCRGFLFSL